MSKIDASMEAQVQKSASQRKAYELILLLGLVSAFGDITYETGRGVSGPYLAFLGASAMVISLTSGLGEFLGYAIRLASGYLVDRRRAYWVAVFIGYGLVLSIPLLAFTRRWEWAVALLLLERLGKGIRSPARDTIISHAAHPVGRGWGFALHEALDQIGGVVGPLVFSAVFAIRNSYADGFNILWISGVMTMVMLLTARLRVPAPEKLERVSTERTGTGSNKPSLTSVFWIYGLFTFLCVAGFVNFPLIAYHLVNRAQIAEGHIPVLYAVAMGVDALAALAIGKVYDRIGLKSLLVLPALTLLLPLVAFTRSFALAVVSAVLWGIVMSGHETVMRATIADLVPGTGRATAYGIFNALYGGAFFVSGAAFGALYQHAGGWVIAYAVAMELLALFVFTRLKLGGKSLEQA